MSEDGLPMKADVEISSSEREHLAEALAVALLEDRIPDFSTRSSFVIATIGLRGWRLRKPRKSKPSFTIDLASEMEARKGGGSLRLRSRG
jgi:hypothetical protein